MQASRIVAACLPHTELLAGTSAVNECTRAALTPRFGPLATVVQSGHSMPCDGAQHTSRAEMWEKEGDWVEGRTVWSSRAKGV